MIPPHFSHQIYLSFSFSKMIALNQNVANCLNTLTALTLKCMLLLQDVWMRQMCMTDAGTTQDNFILPAPPVGELPISQDWLDRTKLGLNRSIPITLPSGKNILADTMFKISIGHTNLCSRVCLFVTSNTSMARYSTKNNIYIFKIKKDTLS